MQEEVKGCGRHHNTAVSPSFLVDLGIHIKKRPVYVKRKKFLETHSHDRRVRDPDDLTKLDHAAVQFATNGRSVNFVIPPNGTSVSLPEAGITVQTGTVAGTIS